MAISANSTARWDSPSCAHSSTIRPVAEPEAVQVTRRAVSAQPGSERRIRASSRPASGSAMSAAAAPYRWISPLIEVTPGASSVG
nr:hypothetical protein [Bailinhaonella thermotolerans]